MSWKDLDIKLKAELIKLGVLSGIRDIKLIRLLYDDINTPTLAVDLSYNETNVKPLLGIKRIKLEYDIPEEEVNRANEIIQLIENEISLEEINNQLPILFRLFKNGGYKNKPPFEEWYKTVPADRNDTTYYNLRKAYEELPFEQLEKWRTATPEQLNNEEYHLPTVSPKSLEFLKSKNHPSIQYELDWYNSPEGKGFRGKHTLDTTGNYYRYIPKDKGGYISNNPTLALIGKVKKYDEGGYKDSKTGLNYIFKGPLKRKKENSLEYRQALFNNVDPRNGYPSPWTAVKYYNTVVDALNSGDTSKKWETDGSIGQETAEAGWAKYLDLPYNKELLPVWNGDTVRLSPELEREIPIDTNLLKLDILEIRYNRDMDRSMGIFDREEAYKTLLLTKQLALNNLRKTYKTGEWVQMNEFMGNSVNPFDWNKDYVSPLNVLLFYGLRYDKNTNSMLYGDSYDLNRYDLFLPGNPFIIRGSIPLDKKKNGGFLFPTKSLVNKVNKFREGGYEDGSENTIYTAGYSEPITVTAKKELSKRQQMQADEEWREYLKQHPIQIGSEEYNRLPERAKAQVYKNSVTDTINKAALPTAAAIIAPTALTAGAASLVGSGALTAAADAAGKVGTKIAGTNLGKAASTFINNPYVNLGLTGLGAYFVPQHFKNGVANIKTGNYIGALGDFGMIGLEALGAANTAKLLTDSVKGMANPLFANPYSPNTLTRVIGTGTSGLDDAVNSGIIRGNPNGGILTAKKLGRQQKILKEIGVPKKTIDNYMSNNLSEKDYEVLKKYVPEWFSDTKNVFQVNGKSFVLGKKGLPTKYEDYIKEFRSANPLFKNKTNFNPLTEREVLLNWEGVPEPTFALSPDLSKKYGFETENVLNGNLFKGDYAILIKNAETHGTPLTLAGHLPEHWTLKYPMEYNHPDITFYKRLGIPFINKNIYYKIDPLKYTTIPLNKNGGFLFPNLAFSHKFEDGGYIFPKGVFLYGMGGSLMSF